VHDGDVPLTTPVSNAQKLRELANDKRCARRADDLKDLANSLATGETDKWAGIDLLAAFPPSATITSPRSTGRVEGIVGALAAISVFAPVAWTWYSLHAASQAYSEMTQSGIKPDDTFLGLWISGFEGYLTGWHRLVPMAVVSVVLIGLAALLMIGHRFAAATVEHRTEESAAEFEARLVSALCAAQREIGSLNAADPTAIEAIVRRSIKQLSEAYDATREGIDRLNATTAGLETAATTLTEAANTTKASTEGVELASVALSEASDESHRRIASTLTAFSDGVSDQLARTQRDTVAAISRSSDAVKTTIDDLVTGVTRYEAAQSAVASSLGDMDARSAANTRDLTVAVQHLQDTVHKIERSLVRHESAMQAQASELTAARDAVEIMLRQLALVGNPQNGDHVDAV